jgi:hypothetical protein
MAQRPQPDFESNLRKLIPEKVSEFAKLEGGEPYRFDLWEHDHSGSACLYYFFSSKDGTKTNRKRVILSEVEAAFDTLRHTGRFDRNHFRTSCPRSESSGRCGFVVVGRILEALGEAKYSGRNEGFVKPPHASA